MKLWKQWKELTIAQKEHAKIQYLEIRANEDEITFDEANSIYNTSDEYMECLRGYEIDTEDEGYIFVNI